MIKEGREGREKEVDVQGRKEGGRKQNKGVEEKVRKKKRRDRK